MKGIKYGFAIGMCIVVLMAIFSQKNTTKTPIYHKIEYQEFDSLKDSNLINISIATPNYLNYPQIIEQLLLWNKEASSITEVGYYGKTKKNKDIVYIKISNQSKKNNPVVLITGSIHGNEPWSTGCVMAYAGNLLNKYGKEKEITDLIDSRDIYIIPVVSPDSYPTNRNIDGVDPNRDFPSKISPNHKSTKTIDSLRNFFIQIKPNAAISTHTSGRFILFPYGDTRKICPNNEDYKLIVNKMALLCDYKSVKASEFYRYPIIGTELDWYYANKAFSIVFEIGDHQRIPTHEEIIDEFDRTWEGIKLFIEKAPLVEII